MQTVSLVERSTRVRDCFCEKSFCWFGKEEQKRLQNASNARGIPLEVLWLAMRKRYRVLILAALVAALVVPVGFALSLESPAPSPQAVVNTSVLMPPVPDAAKLLVVGTVLIGLAAFVRRSA